MKKLSFQNYSSISKKVIMAIAGLFLIVFLLVHLGINLLLLVDDGGKSYGVAVGFMISNPIIKVMEIFLFGSFFIHMLVGIVVTIKNWASRPIDYYVSNKSNTSFFSKYMIYTGIIIVVFLLIHFMNFFFVKLGWVLPPPNVDKHDFYYMAQLLFSNPLYSIIYIVLIIALGFHLNHAFQSAFQTLGLYHQKYIRCLKIAATIYSIVVTVGFCIIPLYFIINPIK